MNQRLRASIIIVASLLLVLPLITLSTFAQSTDYLYFPETDHSVRGEFLEKYTSVPDPVRVFGYPITEELWAPDDSPFAGKRVQYFQRAVFEYRVENAPGHRVQLVPLGSKVIDLAQFVPFDPLPVNHPACETFGGSDYQVCYAFLQFYKGNGGLAIFGAPITDMVIENNRITQYFEYARFEWRPELASGQRVHLTNLGEVYFNANEDPELRFFRPETEAQQIQELHVRAFPLYAVISSRGTQTIYVVVNDQMNKPVAGAVVSLKISLPNKQTYSLLMDPTNQNGLTYVSFAHQGEPVGRVQILIEVSYGSELTKISRLSYRIW